MKWISPGHSLVLQDWDWELFPWQSIPPLVGGGLVQVRMRVWIPPPHVRLQLPQTPQFDQPPLTRKKKKIIRSQNHSKLMFHKTQITILALIIYCWISPGHPFVLQDWDCELFPWQSAPPMAGGGLVQVRVRVCVPLPQVRVQLPQAPQLDQPPSTVEEKEESRLYGW